MSDQIARGRAAVVGAGPAGLYAAAALLAEGMEVDVIDRLPTPFGLVRYGVAPDHPQMRAVARVLRRPLDDGRCGFIGNVALGRDVSLADLRRHYRAVVLATGCPRDRRLGVPGERREGCLGSSGVVAWYNGHPDAGEAPPLDHPTAVVAGGGNVALDVARVLALPACALRATDVPDDVLAALGRSEVREVHVLVRRGAEHVRFTPAELRRLGEVDEIDVVVDEADLHGLDVEALEPAQQDAIELLTQLARRPLRGGGRRPIVLHLHRRIVEVRGSGRVEEVVHEDTRADRSDRVTLPAGLVVSAVGHLAPPIDGLPIESSTGRVDHDAGRVLDDGRPVEGLYVTGWLKRGPSGVIGTNKPCGRETAQAVIADLPHLPLPTDTVPDVAAHLADRGLAPTSWADWLRIERAEEALGAARGTDTVKVHGEDLLAVAVR